MSTINRHTHALRKKEKIISVYKESIILLVFAEEEVWEEKGKMHDLHGGCKTYLPLASTLPSCPSPYAPWSQPSWAASTASPQLGKAGEEHCQVLEDGCTGRCLFLQGAVAWRHPSAEGHNLCPAVPLTFWTVSLPAPAVLVVQPKARHWVLVHFPSSNHSFQN